MFNETDMLEAEKANVAWPKVMELWQQQTTVLHDLERDTPMALAGAKAAFMAEIRKGRLPAVWDPLATEAKRKQATAPIVGGLAAPSVRSNSDEMAAVLSPKPGQTAPPAELAEKTSHGSHAEAPRGSFPTTDTADNLSSPALQQSGGFSGDAARALKAYKPAILAYRGPLAAELSGYTKEELLDCEPLFIALAATMYIPGALFDTLQYGYSASFCTMARIREWLQKGQIIPSIGGLFHTLMSGHTAFPTKGRKGHHQ